jgi:hypothetical protein
MGRSGSLIASTWRSYQSFTAWLVPHTNGPASKVPAITKPQRSDKGALIEMSPHRKAHMGANHVIGFKSSRTVAGAG